MLLAFPPFWTRQINAGKKIPTLTGNPQPPDRIYYLAAIHHSSVSGVWYQGRRARMALKRMQIPPGAQRNVHDH